MEKKCSCGDSKNVIANQELKYMNNVISGLKCTSSTVKAHDVEYFRANWFLQHAVFTSKPRWRKDVTSNERLFEVRATKSSQQSFILLQIYQVHFIVQS